MSKKISPDTPLYNLNLRITPNPEFVNLDSMLMFSANIRHFEYLIKGDYWHSAFTLRTKVRRDGLILPEYEDGLLVLDAEADLVKDHIDGKGDIVQRSIGSFCMNYDLPQPSHGILKLREGFFQTRLQTNPIVYHQLWSIKGFNETFEDEESRRNAIIEQFELRDESIRRLLGLVEGERVSLEDAERIYREQIEDKFKNPKNLEHSTN